MTPTRSRQRKLVPRVESSADPCATVERWVHVEPLRAATYDLAHVGKWLIYLRCRQVATSWGVIAKGTREGQLGISAKIRGHPPEPRSKTNQPDELTFTDLLGGNARHVVCVYTRDWRDLADLERVGRALGELGAVASGILRYKSDAQTYENVYAGNGPVSLFKMSPPYERLEADRGLEPFAASHPAARALSRRLLGADPSAAPATRPPTRARSASASGSRSRKPAGASDRRTGLREAKASLRSTGSASRSAPMSRRAAR